MRTTIRLDDQLIREIKELAVQTGRTLTAVIEDSLRETLSRRRDSKNRQPVQLITAGEGGVRPGVDLSNSAELWDLMDIENDPA